MTGKYPLPRATKDFCLTPPAKAKGRAGFYQRGL
jgi:hypothetical protein